MSIKSKAKAQQPPTQSPLDPKGLSDLQKYVLRLKKVMKRLGITEFDWDYGKDSAWVEFTYAGYTKRFDHSVARAKLNKRKIKDGEEAFWRIVLFIERLALASEDGLYSFGEIVNNLLRLASPLPEWAQFMKFDKLPISEDEVRTQYRARAFECHPDHNPNGSSETMVQLEKARDKALAYVAGLRH